MLRATDLPPHARASFATAARLLSCLVTESLLRALYVPLDSPGCVGVCVVLSGPASAKAPTAYTADDVLVLVPLRHVPVFKHDSDATDARGRDIALLDPLDMLPLVLQVRQGRDALDRSEAREKLVSDVVGALDAAGWGLGKAVNLVALEDSVELWHTYARSIELEAAMAADIASELASAVKWQTYSYEHPAQAPLFDSPSIDWEQSIVEGHPTHPMHKTRHFLHPIPPIEPGDYDLYSPRIRLAALPRESLKITGDFEQLLLPVLECASKNAGAPLEIPEGHVVVPVHELQVRHIRAKFSEAVIYPEAFHVPARAQQSIRSVVLSDALHETHLKLGVGIKLTSAVRTISPASAYLGPRFSAQVVPALRIDPAILTVAKELASVVHAHPDGEVAKHCAAIVRECHENGSEARGERLIVCTSLVESGHAGVESGVPSVVRVFGLDTEEKRIAWLDSFVQLFFAAFLPQVLHNGVAFEAHPQNTVARFSLAAPHKLLGFIIRDFGGLRVHPPTLLASTGVALDVAPGHSIIAETLDDVYTRMYHTMIHNHLQQLIRVLELHYNGKGWDVVRARLRQAVPRGHALERVWLSEDAKTLPGKCFMRMRMVGAYRHHLHAPFPNLLHYMGTSRKADEDSQHSHAVQG
ncbi:hypothetical protein FA95DRAFT_426185 [Auriscalpium vulgare]|uniref:Uncharacterized protein n=1 Tax=Auriscalpium vulgare TaxID=40419 RepID=A0ACB8RI89_9AGAM|nr:hypothetical protein FA95DRAFT_426185 [Auriscalpium vulgare]